MLWIRIQIVINTLFWIIFRVFSPSLPSNNNKRGWEGAARPIANTHFTQSEFNENSATRFVREDSTHQSLVPFIRNSIFSHENAETTARAISCSRYLQYYDHKTSKIIHRHQEASDHTNPCSDNTSRMEPDGHHCEAARRNTESNQQVFQKGDAIVGPTYHSLSLQSHSQ